MKKIIYKLNNNPQIVLAENFYDEQGRLTSKKRHNNADTETFNYNIQNWLTKKTSGTFEENLAYHKAGNISSMVWKNGTTTNKYIYEYDGLNRLTSGVLENGGYGENFTYDKNGNILTLKRYSKNVLIDDLEMRDWQGNQLKGITENVENHSLTNINSLKEYRPKGDGTFKYDDNGNLIEDSDRKILSIEYNVLNLPTEIEFEGGNNIKNVYAADGRKLEIIYTAKITDNREAIERTRNTPSELREITGKHYIGNFEYEYSELDDRFSPELTKIFNAEGYFENENWYYFRKDHLGNNREVWNATQNRTEQINNYYASGLVWASDTRGLRIADNNNQYKFGGKEYIEDFGYDAFVMGFRDYYATIGRFTSIDPLAEGAYSRTPYGYASGNFINEIDFMGLFASGMSSWEPPSTIYNPGMPDDLSGESGASSPLDWERFFEDLFGGKSGGGTLGGTFGGGGGSIFGGGGRLPANFGEIMRGYIEGRISGEVIEGIMMNALYGGNILDKRNFIRYKSGHPDPQKSERESQQKQTLQEQLAEKLATMKIGETIKGKALADVFGDEELTKYVSSITRISATEFTIKRTVGTAIGSALAGIVKDGQAMSKNAKITIKKVKYNKEDAYHIVITGIAKWVTDENPNVKTNFYLQGNKQYYQTSDGKWWSTTY